MIIALATFMALLVGYSAFGHGKLKENWAIIRQYRLHHFLQNALVLVVVIATALGLILFVPFFDKNPILWVISKVFHISSGKGTGNILLAGLKWKLYALIFLPVLMIALPALAQTEEKKYRAGTKDWKQGLRRSLRFGMAHIIMMIPLGAAVALSIGGIWFTHQYFKGGVERSTVYHATYNTMIMGVLFVTLFFVHI